jgi:hypothetical protein
MKQTNIRGVVWLREFTMLYCFVFEEFQSFFSFESLEAG